MKTSLSVLKELPTVTLKGHVIEQIRNAILSGAFQPGERMNEVQLAKQFRVSRIPVREALGQLQEQGLVMNKPRRGMFVISLSEEDVQRINSLRILLESEAIKLCTANMTSTIAKRLEILVERMEDHSKRTDLEASALDLEFHRTIWAYSGNPYLEKSLNSIVTVLFAHQALAYMKVDSLPKWPLDHHRALLNVLLGTSGSSPELAMIKHLRVRYTNPERFCSFALHRDVTVLETSLGAHRAKKTRASR